MFNNGVLFLSEENIRLAGGSVDGMSNLEYLMATIEKILYI